MTAADLLPSSSGPFERALAAALSDDLPVPITDVMDPAKSPPEFLAWLAAHESVDLWFDDRPEARKRQMIADALRLASIRGTRAAAADYLAYVDAAIVHKRSHPERYPVGRIAAGITPINHPPYVARYLVKTDLVAPARAVLVGRTAVGRAAVRTINREPLRRAKIALTASKSPHTAYSVTFAHRVTVTLDDGIDLDAGHKLGDFRDRIRL